jgi:hypothetical protein
VNCVCQYRSNDVWVSIFSELKRKLEYFLITKQRFFSRENMLHSIIDVEIELRIKNQWWSSDDTFKDDARRESREYKLSFIGDFDHDIAIKWTWSYCHSFYLLLWFIGWCWRLLLLKRKMVASCDRTALFILWIFLLFLIIIKLVEYEWLMEVIR